MAITSPHDRLFQATFRHVRHAASWLRRAMPAHVAAKIAWHTLALASERILGLRLRSHVADLVFTANLVDSDDLVLIVIEHKAYPDPHLQAQLLRYVVHLQRLAGRQVRRDPMGEPMAPAQPKVVPVVLHHGEAAAAILANDNVDPFAAFQPRLHFVLDDLHGRSEDELRRDGSMTARATLTHLALANLRTFEREQTLAAIDRWADLLRTVEADGLPDSGDDALDAFGWYLLATTDLSPEDLHMAFAKNLNHSNDSIMTTARRLHQEGLSQGISQGLSQGKAEGQARTLLRLLARRFGNVPAEYEARLLAASQEQLDRCSDRLLDARTLAEVFAD